ncbi:hypothetical protein IU487_07070 [Nocardia puris]|uniref:DUF6194 family protein n=1 Tax=Nocardia puris TaxID=208602 RepID=UPI001893CD63|nr:DUF6194 family protein [Nocardia puris]MBF6210809.1 hypothetical protein [Nocardia puris]
MTIDEIITYLESLGGTLVLRPTEGDGSPEIAWGDVFFYYAPDGNVPTTTQPFATIVTKDYPDEPASRLDRPGAFRLNINAGRDAFVHHTGHTPRETPNHPFDPTAEDTLFPHPTYFSAAWLSVVNPGPGTSPSVNDLLHSAHERARARYERKG